MQPASPEKNCHKTRFSGFKEDSDQREIRQHGRIKPHHQGTTVLGISDTTPRFGWDSRGHGAIREGAFNRLPQTPLKPFLQESRPFIAASDDSQDIYHKGPHHFINLELPVNRFSGNGPLPLDFIFRHFNPNARQWLAGLWQNPPGNGPALPQGETVVTATLTAYRDTRRLMRQVIETQDAGQKETLQLALSDAIGRLSHYVGDLFMPLHSTTYHDWPIHPAFPQSGIHAFLEQAVLTPNDLAQLANPPKTSPLPELTAETLEPFLKRQVLESHLAVYDIVQAQQTCLANPWAAANPYACSTALRTAFRPILLSRMTRAQETLSALLNLAWQQANQQPQPQQKTPRK